VIRFLLGNTAHSATTVDPRTTVLEYLREILQRKGTKDGCATGDCGACTVVLGELEGERMRYRAVNSCIMPLGSLHGKQLISVEDLKRNGALHAVQQAMVDCHGSQCGFCSPGFIMSMFAYLKTYDQPDRAALMDSLGGNLCRCTGYRPILEAGVEMYTQAQVDQFAVAESATVSSLNQIAVQTSPIELKANGRRFHAPESADELASLLQQYPGARLLAGGTDLALEIHRRPQGHGIFLYTGKVKELLDVRDVGTALEIGAAVTYSDFEQSLVELYPDLGELIKRLGSRQIRNLGTMGGNIGNASPTGDMLPFLIVIDAELVMRRGSESRVAVVEDFFVSHRKTILRPGEFIERIIIPKARPGYLFRAYKISKRLGEDISSTCGAFYIDIRDGIIRDANVAFGGMAEITKRAKHCEDALRDQPWTQATVDRAMQELERDFRPISDFRASSGYRMQASKNLLQRLFLESNTPTPGLRVTGFG
jgi:xanthine dehydrogenase small subunit